jgi:hypothetical protein
MPFKNFSNRLNTFKYFEPQKYFGVLSSLHGARLCLRQQVWKNPLYLVGGIYLVVSCVCVYIYIYIYMGVSTSQRNLLPPLSANSSENAISQHITVFSRILVRIILVFILVTAFQREIMRWLKTGKTGTCGKDVGSETRVLVGGVPSMHALSRNELPLISLRRTLLICIGPGTVGSLLIQLHVPHANKSRSAVSSRPWPLQYTSPHISVAQVIAEP